MNNSFKRILCQLQNKQKTLWGILFGPPKWTLVYLYTCSRAFLNSAAFSFACKPLEVRAQVLFIFISSAWPWQRARAEPYLPCLCLPPPAPCCSTLVLTCRPGPQWALGAESSPLEHKLHKLIDLFWAVSPEPAKCLPPSKLSTSICWVMNEWMNDVKIAENQCLTFCLSLLGWGYFNPLHSSHLLMVPVCLPDFRGAFLALPPWISHCLALLPPGLILHDKRCMSASPLSCCRHHLWTRLTPRTETSTYPSCRGPVPSSGLSLVSSFIPSFLPYSWGSINTDELNWIVWSLSSFISQLRGNLLIFTKLKSGALFQMCILFQSQQHKRSPHICSMPGTAQRSSQNWTAVLLF